MESIMDELKAEEELELVDLGEASDLTKGFVGPVTEGGIPPFDRKPQP
jgi:hypothetical protein